MQRRNSSVRAAKQKEGIPVSSVRQIKRGLAGVSIASAHSSSLGLYRGYIGIMEKKMEATIMENQMEKKMENEMETVGFGFIMPLKVAGSVEHSSDSCCGTLGHYWG